MTINEILNMNAKTLTEMMTEAEYNRMRILGYKRTWELLDMLKDYARLSGHDENEDFISVFDYLDYLESIKDENNKMQ